MEIRSCEPDRSRSPRGQRGVISHPGRDQLLPPAERHDAGAPAGGLSDPARRVQPQLRPGRDADLHLPTHRLVAAAADRFLYRSSAAALFAGLRHGRDACRAGDPGPGAQLFRPAGRRHDAGARLGRLSSGIVAHRPAGLRRGPWAGAIAVPGRRQFRRRAGAARRRILCPAARAGRTRLVCARRPGRRGHPDGRGPLVQAQRPCQAHPGHAAVRHPPCPPAR